MTRAEILVRMEPCLWSVSPRAPRPVTEETCLVSDLWLHAHGISRLGELLEKEFSITLPQVELIGLVLGGPTLGKLVEIVALALHAV